MHGVIPPPAVSLGTWSRVTGEAVRPPRPPAIVHQDLSDMMLMTLLYFRHTPLPNSGVLSLGDAAKCRLHRAPAYRSGPASVLRMTLAAVRGWIATAHG